MQKIPTMFERDEFVKGHPVKNVLKPECQWVADGEGTATHKMDGTNVKIEGGALYKRQKPKEGDYDKASYALCDRADPADKYMLEAFDALADKADGIYEAIGPKIQKNPEGFDHHALVRVVPFDSSLACGDVPRTFDGLREYLANEDMEGIVFHHPDGRFAKIKKRDFGLKR
jgi:hypothetical protein